MLAGLLQEEEGGLRVHRRHLVVLGLADLDHWLLQHLADGVDGNVGLADRGDRVSEQFLDGAGGREVGLEGNGLGASSLDGGDGLVGIRPGGGTVVVDGDRLSALRGEIAGD